MQICGKDLRRSPAVILDGDDAILHAQQCINTIIATGTADLGVYRNAPVAARIALADLKALATRLARQYSGSGDEPGLQGEELCEIDPADDTLGARKVSAMQPALALTDALRVLSAPDIAHRWPAPANPDRNDPPTRASSQRHLDSDMGYLDKQNAYRSATGRGLALAVPE